MSESDHFTAPYASMDSSLRTDPLTSGDFQSGTRQSTCDRSVLARAAEGNLEESMDGSEVALARVPTLAPSDLSFPNRSAPAPLSDDIPATVDVFIKRADLSLADISQMRLDGCRTHRPTPISSNGSSAGLLALAVQPSLSTCSLDHALRRRENGVVSDSSLTGPGRSMRTVSRLTSSSTNALDTSVAILQHMAMDTAAKVCASAGLSPCHPQTPVSPTHIVVPAGHAHPDGSLTTDPIGLVDDGDRVCPPSLVHSGDTQPYRPSSTSPLQSLSVSELVEVHQRPLIASASTAAPPFLADRRGSGASAFAATAVLTPQRLRLVRVATASLSDKEEDLPVPTAPMTAVPHDASVYNHDFQRILSHEVKEALTRNMRPGIEEEDDDEVEALLHGAVSKPMSPAPASSTTAAGIVSPEVSRSAAYAPFRFPLAATSIGKLDSEDTSPTTRPDSRSDMVGGPSDGSCGWLPVSETPVGGQRGRRGSGAPTALVSAQAWRFPTLGTAPTRTASLRSESSEGNTHDTAPATGSTSAYARRSSVPHPPPRGESPSKGKSVPTQRRAEYSGQGDDDDVAARSQRAAARLLASAPAAAGVRGGADDAVFDHLRHHVLPPATLYSSPPLMEDTTTATASPLPTGGSESYHRKLEMLCTVYERLQRRQRKHSEQTSGQSSGNRGHNAGTHGRGAAVVSPPRGPSANIIRSPSLSYSGALGHSAGYYSFGVRVSLSHPNRQTIPHQFLGSSMTRLHSTPSSQSAMLGSPAIMNLVSGADSGISNSVVGSVRHGVGPESSPTERAISAGRAARRSLDSLLLRRIEQRPLLQTTLFLEHTLRCIHEAASTKQRERNGVAHAPAPDKDTATSSSGLGGSGDSSAAAAPTAATAENGACTATTLNRDRRSSLVTPTASVTSRSSENQEAPNLSAQVPTCGHSYASASPVDKTVHSEAVADGTETVAVASPVQPTSVKEDSRDQAQRYYRALTEAAQRVSHVHGVDGIEREVDNESMDLIVYVGMRLLGWLEVVSLLGCGSFGQVFLCKDLRICDGFFVHPGEIGGVDYEYWNCSHAFLPFSSVDVAPTNPPLVAVKVVKSVPLLEQQSVLEAEMLVLIGAQTGRQTGEASRGPPLPSDAPCPPPPADPRCTHVAKVLADGISYGHHCIVMERYGANLYEYIAANEHVGLPMYQIRSIGAQLFSALSLIHECHIIHADIKPENMLLTLDSSRAVVRGTESTPGANSSTVSTEKGRTTSPQPEPPRLQPRTEETPDGASGSLERSYITLRAVHADPSRRRRGSTTVAAPDASNSLLSQGNGRSFRHIRSSGPSAALVVEETSVPAPEPRRVQALNQSAGMLSARAPTSGGVGGSASFSFAHYSILLPSTPAVPVIPRLRVKLIDFSSSCYDGGPFYQYIQSRYYRAPEVIIGATYNSGIDIWSSGCMLAELMLGMPLLPGCNDHHQLCLMEEMIGPLPANLIEEGVNAELYYHSTDDDAAASECELAAESNVPAAAPGLSPRPFALRTREEFFALAQAEPQPYRRYFTYHTLQDLVRHCPLTLEERRMSNGLPPYVSANESAVIPADATPSPSVRAEVMKQRLLLFDLLRCLLRPDARLRPTATQVLTHPFFTSAPPYMKTFGLE